VSCISANDNSFGSQVLDFTPQEWVQNDASLGDSVPTNPL
jgi:hypothetical protein